METLIPKIDANAQDLWHQFELKLGRFIRAHKHLESIAKGVPFCIKLVIAPGTDETHVQNTQTKLRSWGWEIHDTTTVGVDDMDNELYGFCMSKDLSEIYALGGPRRTIATSSHDCCDDR